MQRRIAFAVIALTIVTGFALQYLPAQEAAAPPAVAQQDAIAPPNTVNEKNFAVGLLRVDCAPESGLASPMLIRSLLHNREFMAQLLAAAKLTPTPGAPPVQFVIGEIPGGKTQLPANICELRIEVRSQDGAVAAADVLNAVPAALIGKLQQLDTRRDPSRLNLLTREIDDVTTSLKELHLRREELSRRLGLIDPDIAGKLQFELTSKWSSAMVEKQALTMSVQVLREAIAEISKQVEHDIVVDATVAELNRHADLLEQKLKVLRAGFEAGGQVKQEQVFDAEADVAAARADVAKFRRTLVESTGGRRLDELRQRLDAANVELAVQEARVKVLQEQIQKLPRSDNFEVQHLQLQIDANQSQLVRLLEESLQSKQQLEQLQSPQVLLIREG